LPDASRPSAADPCAAGSLWRSGRRTRIGARDFDSISPRGQDAYTAFGGDAAQCVEGNVEQVGSSSTGYAQFGTTDTQYDSLMFHDVDPAVEAAANALRTNDPCGQIESILTGTAIDIANVGAINVPIAYVHAGSDGIFQALK
jgi:hypothetical protein